MRIFIGKLSWFNGVSCKEEKCNFFCAAESYTDAMGRCVEHFGESEIVAITLREFADSEFVEFWGSEEEKVFNEAEAVAVEHVTW